MRTLAAFLANVLPTPNPPTPPTVRPELDPQDMAVLRVTLEDVRDAFSIIILIAPVGRSRDALLSTLRAWSGQGDVPPLLFSDLALHPNETILGHLREITDHAAPGTGVVLHDFDRYFHRNAAGPYTDERIGALNMGRDLLRSIVRGPFVLVLDEASVLTMQTAMPDFYSWRIFERTL